MVSGRDVLTVVQVIVASLLLGACSEKPTTSAVETQPATAATHTSTASAGDEEPAPPVPDRVPLAADLRNALGAMNAEFPRRHVRAAPFELADLKGELTSLTSYRGRVVLLSFWATWCAPCVTEMPSMERLYRQLRDEGLAIVGINLMEDSRTVAKFVRERVKVSFDILLDSTGAVSRTYGARTLPTSYLINRSGRIVARIIGAREWDRTEIIAAIRTLLESDQGGAAAAPVSMEHIHGLGYSSDGTQILVPAHDGLRVFRDDAWSVPPGPRHDYMGFAAAADGFYSSGHPAPDSGLPDPLGLVKSTDGGLSLVTLAASGRSDFHMMTVGYHTGVIYVVSDPGSGSGRTRGDVLSHELHYSIDEGRTWTPSALQGLGDHINQLASHPVDANAIALGTDGGVYWSDDHAESVSKLWSGGTVTALAFSPDGKRLLFWSERLYLLDLSSLTVREVAFPALAPDEVLTYLAFNPASSDELVAATSHLNIYLHGGAPRENLPLITWRQILRSGSSE